jgi:MoxR-like ATPase
MLEPKHPNRPQVLFLDEWNYAQPSVLTIMNSLTDARRNVRIPELAGMASRTGSGWDFKAGDPIVKRQPNHYIIIGMNPSEKTQYSGTNAMNIAQLRRFESLRIEYLKEGPELEVIQLTVPEADTLTFEKLIHFAAWSRTQYTKEELSVPITTGNLIAYAKLMRGGLDMSDIIEIIQAMFREDELESVKGSLMTLKLAKAVK